jgi:glycylpeptide N-tetradecanoyltransferase
MLLAILLIGMQDADTHQITDFFSFYLLESTVIGNLKNSNIRAAYLFYYASETALKGEDDGKRALKARLNALLEDALIVAKQVSQLIRAHICGFQQLTSVGQFDFDVFNALTLLDNALFLEKQKFGAGDGRLNYYLYNYSTAPIHGGLDRHENPDEKHCSGVGVVML